FGVRHVAVSDDDVHVLSEYRWPGNVREMAAVMDRAVLIGQGRTLDVAGALGRPGSPPAPVPVLPASEQPPGSPWSIEPLDVVIRGHIESALRVAHGRVEGPHGAAR